MMQDPQLKACKEMCWATRTECMETFFTYCVRQGDTHTSPKHMKIMMDCMQICQLAADFITRDSDMYYTVCSTVADICEACAKSCEKIGDSRMRKTAEICRNCAACCRKMPELRKVA